MSWYLTRSIDWTSSDLSFPVCELCGEIPFLAYMKARNEVGRGAPC